MAGRQANRHMNRWTNGQTDKHVQRDGQMVGTMDRQIDGIQKRQTVNRKGRQAGAQVVRQLSRQAGGQACKRRNRLADRPITVGRGCMHAIWGDSINTEAPPIELF